ncbi:unnamed protein product [Protopolystoma xenopodis]|uniref:Uncharacterized protein n=1 Tax=Protopolystoma xenopodis TaxID=117903 RepID=A0A3S5AUA4_9PLAT|nr:unnamed protein product [Protopolystoma xenopodis]
MMPTTMPVKRLGMYHINGPNLEMMMVRSYKSSYQYDQVAKTRSNNLQANFWLPFTIGDFAYLLWEYLSSLYKCYRREAVLRREGICRLTESLTANVLLGPPSCEA